MAALTCGASWRPERFVGCAPENAKWSGVSVAAHLVVRNQAVVWPAFEPDIVPFNLSRGCCFASLELGMLQQCQTARWVPTNPARSETHQ